MKVEILENLITNYPENSYKIFLSFHSHVQLYLRALTSAEKYILC